MTSFEDIDLDISNYDLNEILGLFNLSHDFTYDDLKKTYKYVLKTHPDKSNLPKEYFLFFSKAFKIVNKIYDYKSKRNEKCSRTSFYKQWLRENDEGNKSNTDKQVVDFLSKFKNVSDFNSWFNTHFEKVRLYNPEKDGGHGEWLSQEDDDIISASNINDMHQAINTKKQEQRSLVIHREYNDMVINSGHNSKATDFYDPHQTHTNNKDYSSGFTDRFKYNDLKKAYTESVVPVTEQDYIERKKYSFQQMKDIHREKISPLTKQELQYKLQKQAQQQSKIDTHKAYLYAREIDRINDSHTKWKSYMLKIGDK